MNKYIKDAIDNAKSEAPFCADGLALEIKPLLRDYFVGSFKLNGNEIICDFLNGQKFCVKVEEVK